MSAKNSGSPEQAGGLFGLKREMGFSRQEFFRILPTALADNPYTINGDTIEVSVKTGKVIIKLGVEWERKLSEHVRFPVLPVDIQLVAVDDETQKIFFKRFNSAYMKGLG